MARLFGNIDRSKMIPVRDFLTARKSASSWPYTGCLKKIWLGREIDREWFLSKRNTVRAEVVRKVVPSRKYGESLTDLEFAHLSPGSKPASRTARLRDERPCIRSLVSARDATRFCPRIEFCGCYCLTVACAHVYRDLGCFQWRQCQWMERRPEERFAWKHGRWRRDLSVAFDLLCID